MYCIGLGASSATLLISTCKKPVVLDGCRVRVEAAIEVKIHKCNGAYIRPAR